MSRQLIIELGKKRRHGDFVPGHSRDHLRWNCALLWPWSSFKSSRTSLVEWCFLSCQMKFVTISRSSHSMHLKLLSIPFLKLQIYIYTFSAFTTSVSYFHCLLKDFAQRKSPHAVTLTLREGKVGTLGTPGVFCEIKHTLILLWFAVWLPLKHALWHWDPAAFEFWLVVFPHQTLVTLLEKAAQLAPRLAETAY